MQALDREILQHVSDVTSAAVQRTVGRYEVLRELGRGATSVVHLARQVDLDREVALKELVALRSADPRLTERFLRESRLTGSLTHPNVVTVYEYFEDGGTPFIAMEYLERGSLRPHVGRLTVAQVVGVLEGLLGGLAHAHAHGVVHRDLKPENVLVTSAGSVKIADFGIAKALGSDSLLTLSGTTVGTPAYMAPEQAMAAEVGPGADLYAVGAIAYELLSGDVPFHGSDVAMAVMLQHLNEPVPPLRDARPDLDPDLCAWVERMLAKAPGERPASAAEAWDELDDIVIRALGPRWRRASRITGSHLPPPPAGAGAARGTPATARAPAPTPTPWQALPDPRRRLLVAGLVAAAIALGGAGIAVAVVSSGKGDGTAARETETTTSSAGTTTDPGSRVTGPLLAAVKLEETAGGDLATLRMTGPALAPGSVVVRDRDVADGHAWLELRQPGIGARVKEVARGSLAARVRTGKNLVRVDLTAKPGTYESLRLRRPDGRRVVVALSKPAPVESSPPPVSGSSDTTPTTTTTPSTTTTTTPEKTKPPSWGTG